MTPSQSAKSGHGRQIRAAAGVLAVLLPLAIATLYDEAFVLWLAHYPEQPWSVLLNRLLLAGPVRGAPAIIILLFLTATLIHLLARDSLAKGRLSRWRGAAGFVMASGVATAVSVIVADRLMARALPMQVLTGDISFTPWFALLETPPRGIGAGIAGGNTAATAWLGASALLVLARGRKNAALAIGVLSILITGLVGIAAISAQTAWPFDAALSAILGFLVPALLYRLSRESTAEDNPGESSARPWQNHPAAHGRWAVRFSAISIGLGISGALIGASIRGNFAGSSWLHLATGLAALIFFGWRLSGLVRPYLPTRGTNP